MSQSLLFIIGTLVFIVTLLGALWFGYRAMSDSYDLDVAAQLALEGLVPIPVPTPVPVARSSP